MKESLTSVLPWRADEADVVLNPSWVRRAAWTLPCKRGLDVAVALAFLLIFAPLLLSLVLLVYLAQGRPIFIRHSRVGRNGTAFGCFKFRSMCTDGDAVLRAHLTASPEAREEWESSRKLKDDPRVTPLGRVLRKSSLDELPQLYNVLRGEMSLVGPRPIVQDEVRFYGNHFSLYKRVRPGLTGSWQVSGRSDTSYPVRVQMDADYVSNWSLGRDVSILFRTVPAVLKSKGSY